MTKKIRAAAIAAGFLIFTNFAFAQGTTFTYQGRLDLSGSPASGSYDFRFRLAADPAGNNYLGSPVLTNAVPVTNGLFAAELDFGPLFTGSNYWLAVDVKSNGLANYTSLVPLQPLTPAPYAIMANNASNLLGMLPAAQLSGTIADGNLPASPIFSGTLNAGSFSGNGGGLTNLNAGNLSSGTVPLAALPSQVVTNNEAAVILNNLNLNSASALSRSLYVTGNRTNNWPNSVSWLENTDATTNASPALRVVVNPANAAGARTPDGALSVSVGVPSSAPNSLIAEFGNSTAFCGHHHQRRHHLQQRRGLDQRPKHEGEFYGPGYQNCAGQGRQSAGHPMELQGRLRREAPHRPGSAGFSLSLRPERG